MRLMYGPGYSITTHAMKPTSDMRAPITECGMKGSLTFSNPHPERALSCQRCRKALNLPNIMDSRRQFKRDEARRLRQQSFKTI